MRCWLLACGAACLPPGQADAAGVVSLNLCTDQLLVLLAPERIAALSPLARDPALSVVAAQAAALPWVRADTEAVLRLRPDLVLAGDYGAQAVVAALKDRGLRVVQVTEPRDFSGVAAEIASVARALDQPARGVALVAAMQARLAAISRASRGSAIFWEARGYASGPGSFGDAVLHAAGYSNAGTGGEMGVEMLAAHPPGLLVTTAAPAYPSLATDMLWHPALRHLRRASVAPALMACAGPWSAGAVEVLAR